MYTHTGAGAAIGRLAQSRSQEFGEGQTGSALMGSLQTSCFFDRGTFGVLPLTYLCFPKSAQGTFFPNMSKLITFAAAPLVLTPFVRNQNIYTNALPYFP